MFGYVKPCTMELKVKDYYKFKAYYCGLCRSLKSNYGNIPRFTLNYDMTFLALLIDSISNEENSFEDSFCIVHPFKKIRVLKTNSALDYASFCNLTLFSYKLLDDYEDDKNLKSKFIYTLLNPYFKKIPKELEKTKFLVESKLKELYTLENSKEDISLDEISHVFAQLTGSLLSSYFKGKDFEETLYWFGYNLGKWIYIIDAFDDLEKDMENKKFNAINKALNKNNLNYTEFKSEISSRIEFTLLNCGRECVNNLNKLPINKNYDLLENILKYGFMEKIDKVFKRSDLKDEKSL
ncbi:DUF5685 family protein [Haloimpatiens sp. FM7315]|uniref:DUF5685 family protein n=1 Tax=Haloimpatiens sp. FM7315 TaxID=3298609 RepID=UPI0035A389E3